MRCARAHDHAAARTRRMSPLPVRMRTDTWRSLAAGCDSTGISDCTRPDPLVTSRRADVPAGTPTTIEPEPLTKSTSPYATPTRTSPDPARVRTEPRDVPTVRSPEPHAEVSAPVTSPKSTLPEPARDCASPRTSCTCALPLPKRSRRSPSTSTDAAPEARSADPTRPSIVIAAVY